MIFHMPTYTWIIYQTWKTMFDFISKHQEESWKYDAQRSISAELWGGNVVKHCLEGLSVWYIFSIENKTNEKTEIQNCKNLC